LLGFGGLKVKYSLSTILAIKSEKHTLEAIDNL